MGRSSICTVVWSRDIRLTWYCTFSLCGTVLQAKRMFSDILLLALVGTLINAALISLIARRALWPFLLHAL